MSDGGNGKIQMDSTLQHSQGSDDDIQIVKVVPIKKPSLSWVASSFDTMSFQPAPPLKSQTTPKSEKKTIPRKMTARQSSLSHYTLESRTQNQIGQPGLPHKRLTSCPAPPVTKKVASSSELWLEKYKPLKREDLAVAKKKVDVIAEWLSSNSLNVTKHKAPILLLTGPPGAGKTACVHILCQEMGIDVQEWSSTSEQAADQWSSEDFRLDGRSRVDVYMSQSQNVLFNNFLLRTSKYQALVQEKSVESKKCQQSEKLERSQRKVIIVEDIPNIFFREVQKFHDILRNYRYRGCCPLVFIQSEANNNSSSILRLFPGDLQQSLGITNISLNAVTLFNLGKILNSIVSRENKLSRFSLPSPSAIEAIAESSGGDLRSAINTLQFACRSDMTDLKVHTNSLSSKRKKNSTTTSKKKKDHGQDTLQEDGGPGGTHALFGSKDTSVFLFRAIGKILYFKRGERTDNKKLPDLPQHLAEHYRDPLMCIPEEVAHKSHLPADYFNSFLHENYADFLSTVESLSRASDYFGDADLFSALWSAREELQGIAVSVATRGYIHSNTDMNRNDSSKKMSWKPLHRSGWFNASKQASENITMARQLFKGYHWEPETLCTEIIPYISLTNPTLHDTGQIEFVQKMTQFSRRFSGVRAHQERLEEKDVIINEENEETSRADPSLNVSAASMTVTKSNSRVDEDDVDIETVNGSQTKVQNLLYHEEEEVVIEDFDD